MKPFKDFEKAIFEWLLQLNKQDPSFCFSTRRKASPGAERNYFIGTEKSGYFMTTFWEIPISFPGNTGDLIDIHFSQSEYGFKSLILFRQTKNPADEQNRMALGFILRLKESLKAANFKTDYEVGSDAKHEYFDYIICRDEPNLEQFMAKTKSKLDELIPLISKELVLFKKQNPAFNGIRIDTQLFVEYQKRLQRRLIKYTTPEAPETDKKSNENITFLPLNQILFGPPGTGKTYHTVNRALEIIENKSGQELEIEDRSELILRFREHQKNGRIAFCTFHQSMSYEDFVEGIKPVMEETEEDPGQLRYAVQSGIFKVLADRAGQSEKGLIRQEFQEAHKKISSGKVMNFGKIRMPAGWGPGQSDYEYCRNNQCIFVPQVIPGDFSDCRNQQQVKEKLDQLGPHSVHVSTAIQTIHNWLQNGSLIFITNSSQDIVTDILEVNGNYYYHPNYEGGFTHFRKVKWLATNCKIPAQDIYSSKFGSFVACVVYSERVKTDFVYVPNKEVKQPYVLIIDEINRGNVSQIFGELITLIEEDKRTGKPESLEVILPYSKQPFSVPPNLYIIGTMNTADRSVEALDTALRRRFVFEEKGPESRLLSPTRMYWQLLWDYKDLEWEQEPFLSKEHSMYELFGAGHRNWKERLAIWDSHFEDDTPDFEKQGPLLEGFFDTNGLNLEKLLTTINSRIELLISKDNQIGHSYFFNVYSEEDLLTVFYKSIIPLLQEYFYGDYGKIGLVLGKGFVELVDSKPFADFMYETKEDLAERVIYRIKDYRIYDSSGFKAAVKAIYS